MFEESESALTPFFPIWDTNLIFCQDLSSSVISFKYNENVEVYSNLHYLHGCWTARERRHREV